MSYCAFPMPLLKFLLQRKWATLVLMMLCMKMTIMKAMWKLITKESASDNTSNPDEDQDQDDLAAAMESSAEVWTDDDDIEDRDDHDDEIGVI